MTDRREIKVDYIARVEGEGSLEIKIKGDQVEELVLNIFEPPRFFEAFLEGRKFYEVPDMVARICGICPVSHMMASVLAIEDAFDIEAANQTRQLRDLLAFSQWLSSHALHVYLLALPDYLGYESALALPEEYLPVVQRAFRLKKLGNDLTALNGGRAVHPVTVVVNGFTDVPTRSQLWAIRDRLKEAKEDTLSTVELVAGWELPDLVRDCEHIALTRPDHYAVNGGNLGSTRGLDLPPSQYRSHIVEHHVPPSHALRSYVNEQETYLVGPLARVNVNFDQLSPDAKEAAQATGIKFPNFNPFVSGLARAIEMVHAIDECISIIEERLDLAPVSRTLRVRAGEGFGISEAPRGLLWHHYNLDDDGIVEKAEIVSPTAQNSANIEANLQQFVAGMIDQPDDEIALKCEMLVRAYDPCISCSVHFLQVKITRE